LALVETNKAALMIVGDWAKGDFSAASLTLDKDYGCELAAWFVGCLHHDN